MSNTYATVLALLPTPYLDYLMDEVSGDYENNGNGGTVDVTQSGEPMRESPGVIRNAPFEYGMWDQPQADIFAASPGAGVAAFPAVTGWTTGAFSCAFMRFGQLDGDDFYPFSLTYRNSTTLAIGNGTGIVVNEDGRLFFVIARTIDSGSADSLMWSSDAVSGVIDDGTPYIVTVTQRGDSTGLHVFVNGVEEAGTLTLGASATNNSFLDLYVGSGITTAGPIVFDGLATGTTGTFSATANAQAIVQRPTVWRNDSLSDGQIQSLHNAAALSAVPQDYYEFMLDRFVVGTVARAYYLQLGWLAATTPASTMETGDVNVIDHPRMDWNPARQLTNQTDSSRVTNYNAFFSRFNDGGGQYTGALAASDLDGVGVGTVSVLITHNTTLGLLDSDRRAIYSWGEGLGGDDENVVIHLGGTALGTTVIVTIGQVNATGTTTGDFYRRVYLPADTGLSLAVPLFALITLTQDGSGLKLYVNDDLITTFAESSSGSAYTEDGWWSQLASPSSERTNIGYPGSTTHVQDLDIHHFMVISGTAMTAAQISEMWDAINGIFPAPSAPPSGGFNDTLVNTGNEPPGNPNGPGPDHYWRMNAAAAPIIDVGIAVVKGTSRATGGDPTFETTGPLISDPTNRAIFFDGQGDYFEVGLDGAAGQLVTSNIGTVGFFLSRADLTKNIAYSQANDLATAFIEWYVEGDDIEFQIQTSAGNSATYRSSIEASSLDFFFIVMTSDGSNYKIYVNSGDEDTAAVLTLLGTATEGLWFNDITATRSAIGARADSSFNVQARARVSELFIYEEVLTGAQIGALFEAAVADGSLGAANALGVLSFDNVTFRNGGLADVRLQAPSTFQQVLKMQDCVFEGGAQGATAQSVSIKGAAVGHIKGSSFSLGETPTTGRAAIVATAIDPTAAPANYGSLQVSDNTFDRMGYVVGSVVRSPVFLEAGFGATVEKNRFFDCFGSAIGWRGDARRVQVYKNIIDGITGNVGAIYAQQGLNSNTGNNWLIGGNAIEVASGNALRLIGANLAGTSFARNIQILRNQTNVAAAEGFFLNQLSDLSVKRNVIAGSPTEGIRLGLMSGLLKLQRNEISGNTDEAIIMSEASVQVATLVLDRNTIESALVGDGVLVTNVARLNITNNKMTNVVNGYQIGNVSISGQFFGNQLTTVTTPFFIIGGTTQVAFEIGQNQLTDLGAAKTLTVVSNAVQVIAPYHLITSAGAVDLNGLGAFSQDGYTVILQLATGSADITVRDAVGNIRTAGDFLMDTPGQDQIWLVRNGTDWDELARFTG